MQPTVETEPYQTSTYFTVFIRGLRACQAAMESEGGTQPLARICETPWSAVLAWFGHLICIEVLQDLPCQWFFDLGVSGDSFYRPILRINPE